MIIYIYSESESKNLGKNFKMTVNIDIPYKNYTMKELREFLETEENLPKETIILWKDEKTGEDRGIKIRTDTILSRL